jgi:hypothetical protein
MILHYTDTEYEDTVWEVTKREVWMDAKSRNDVSLDFPNLPYWIDGNVKLTQSSAILRHLARKNGLYGLTDANADEIGMYIFPACFYIPKKNSNLNSNCSNLLDMRNLQLKKHSVTKNCSDLSLF